MAWSSEWVDAEDLAAFESPVPARSIGRSSRGGGRSFAAPGQKMTLADINALQLDDTGKTTVSVEGLVLQRSSAPRLFTDKKDPSKQRGVASILLRDGTDTIHVSCWGSQAWLEDLLGRVHPGQAVEVQDARVELKAGHNTQYNPWTSSKHKLSVNETGGAVDPSTADFSALVDRPYNNESPFVSVDDILGGRTPPDTYCNTLVGIIDAGSARTITTRKGKECRLWTLQAMDAQSDKPLVITTWEDHLMAAIKTWDARATVVFILDAKVSFDKYRRSLVLQLDKCTVVFTNPPIAAARTLYASLTESGMAALPMGGASSVNLATITTPYTMASIQDLQLGTTGDVHGLVAGELTEFDLLSPYAVCSTCSGCQAMLKTPQDKCASLDCDSFGQRQVRCFYRLKGSVADHSDTLTSVKISTQLAEKLMGRPAEDAVDLTEDDKALQRLQVLFQHCNFKFRASPGPNGQPRVELLDAHPITAAQLEAQLQRC